ncbi:MULTISPECIES: SRPBCC family protein [unclassified Sphingopyxis]|uniref:SRPBCC family protein n=1 Tax=unclassified Sphingopyxis TaxID=2614943 RepID=UPI0007362BB8|nr:MULTISPECIES: SRPBCC family protein [unclassified Sphingopyxis]KTE37549.1 hypothetical protein ATE62_13625 [Sphingopyxis sp. HIX]KTE72158.1 hypothetical protein ATE72_22400 [Sphingopyxis sp. HXXIV]
MTYLRTELPAALRYALAAAALILSQHVMVFLAFYALDMPLALDDYFWLFPIRQLAMLPDASPFVAIGAFAFCLGISGALARLSLRRAQRLGRGGGLALGAMIPTLQIFAVVILALLWPRRDAADHYRAGDPAPPHQIAIGIFAGTALIVVAVAVSALTMGAYGWGLFVATPFLVGLITGFLANRGPVRSVGDTVGAVAAAGALGTLALLMLALEGLMCVILILPLAAGLAIVGGLVGRAAAKRLVDPRQPFYSVALLPLIFLLDAAMPPELPIATRAAITIDAPPEAVWASLTADRPVREKPGLVGLAGLAYPVAARIAGEGVGAHRHGSFSTGTADERVTVWLPGRALAFRVVRQPPAMEEMSPYRKLQTPHLVGYFDTGETRFDLDPLPGGRTRLTVRAGHVLRIDPVLYWGPIARWAIGQNVGRVLSDVRRDAEGRHEAGLAAHSRDGQSPAQLAD